MGATCLFAETHSALPDSRAAAKLIELLDKYLGLKVDYRPLIDKAEKFEMKIKDLLTKAQSATQMAEKKKQTYIG
jgi:predicted ATP-grasp superfamily ATP-dependent carboligase